MSKECRGDKILHEIELLMGEYRSAIREYGASENQRNYYKVKLDALFDLMRRLD